MENARFCVTEAGLCDWYISLRKISRLATRTGPADKKAHWFLGSGMHGSRDKLAKTLYGGKNKISIAMLALGQPRSILREAKQGTSVALLSFLVKEREVMTPKRSRLLGWFGGSSLLN